MASSINRADDKGAEEVLRLAKSLGVTRYRMSYYRYQAGKSPREQVKEFKRNQLDDARDWARNWASLDP